MAETGFALIDGNLDLYTMSSDWYFTDKECLLVADKKLFFTPFSHQSIDS
jgi:hypothetical protein